jgi:hypothetical protein
LKVAISVILSFANGSISYPKAKAGKDHGCSYRISRFFKFASILILREKPKDVTGIWPRLVMKFSYLILISLSYIFSGFLRLIFEKIIVAVRKDE